MAAAQFPGSKSGEEGDGVHIQALLENFPAPAGWNSS
jgi:hypothetical protein